MEEKILEENTPKYGQWRVTGDGLLRDFYFLLFVCLHYLHILQWALHS